jgi:predicted MFS family arabinose efflux permease
METGHANTSVSLAAYWRLVRENANFRYLWLAQIVSEIGDWFYTLALFSLLLQLTGQAESVGLALMVQVVPQTLVGPLAGVINDRLRRKSVMIAADVIRFVIVLSMLLVRSRGTVWLVYPLLLLETATAAFFAPARSAVIPNVVSTDDVILANTLSASTWSFNLMIGAALGGIVAALWGRDAVFILNALSFLMSALFISRMRFREPHAEASPPLRPGDLVDFSPVIEGIRYVRQDRGLLATVFAKAGELMVGPGWVLFTVMGHRYFPVNWKGNDPERATMLGMSFLIGARGIGTLFGPLLSSRWAGQSERRLRQGIFLGYIIIAIGYAALGGAYNVWIACLYIAFAHCGGSTVWVFSTTLLQLNTEDRFRGRVFAADNALGMLSIAVGAYICGRFMDWGFSPRVLATAVGVSMILPAALWAWAVRPWRQPGAVARPA